MYYADENTWGRGKGLSTADLRAEALRAHVKSIYPGFRYLLLIGKSDPDDGNVPMKNVYPYPWRDCAPVATDYYYADLTSNWDVAGPDGNNPNGRPGEVWDITGGGIDGVPDMYVGRIPYYGDISAVDSILNKIMAFENAPDVGPWAERILLPSHGSNGGEPDYWHPNWEMGEKIRPDVCRAAAQDLAAAGGARPYTWAIQTVLPPGLSLSSQGDIWGRPTAVTSSGGLTGSQNLTVTLKATAADGAVRVKSLSLPIRAATGDVLWRNGETGELHVWYMNGAKQERLGVLLGSELLFPETGSYVCGTANDFNADRETDLVWHDPSMGDVQLRYLSRIQQTGSESVDRQVANSDWKLVGSGDFDRNGKPELLWHNLAGAIHVWYLNGAHYLSSGVVNRTRARGDWNIEAVRDFNRDGSVDLFWHNGATGANEVWYLSGTNVTSIGLPYDKRADSTGWRIGGVNDF